MGPLVATVAQAGQPGKARKSVASLTGGWPVAGEGWPLVARVAQAGQPGKARKSVASLTGGWPLAGEGWPLVARVAQAGQLGKARTSVASLTGGWPLAGEGWPWGALTHLWVQVNSMAQSAKPGISGQPHWRLACGWAGVATGGHSGSGRAARKS